MRRSLPCLSVLLLLPTVAAATDLGAHVEAWSLTRVGQDGSDGQDIAYGVAISSADGVLAVGQVDGAAQHGHDALAIEWAPDTTVRWEETTDSGPVGAGRPASEDRWNAVAFDTTDEVVLCGVVGAAQVGDPAALYRVEGRDAGTPPMPDWNLSYPDGTSLRQECRGVAVSGGLTWTAGWADHGADVGRWLSLEFDNVGAITPPIVAFNHFNIAAVPDQASGIAVHALSGEVTIVGERGASGTPASLTNNSDWHVRRYDAAGALLWQATVAGGAGLIDRATGVVVDQATGDAVVVGYTNNGTDNAGNADLDWHMVRYGRLGDGLGGPDIVWTQTFASTADASEGATSVAVDDNGDLLVAGWAIDGGTGKEIWRVGQYALVDGTETDEWLGPVATGDARPQAIASRGDLVALAGFVEATAGDADFAVTLLDLDDDGDGTADSVDACPDDPAKAADEGECGCGVPDQDTDGDTFLNCLEECPDDPNKQDPGVCGCNDPDIDTDTDGTYDCDDACPTDPEKVDNDINSGGCGCGSPNTDSDGDGVLGCNDACANTPPDTEVDDFGCPLGTGPTTDDTGDPGTEPTDEGDKGGCGCATGSPAGGLLLAVPFLLARSRRRR